jgi:hypothetical protein
MSTKISEMSNSQIRAEAGMISGRLLAFGHDSVPRDVGQLAPRLALLTMALLRRRGWPE